MERIAKSEQRIRELMNEPQIRDTFLADKRDAWNRLCVAMDVVGDTAVALIEYEDFGMGQRPGERYMRLYGALQAIVLQQDAISAIHEIFLDARPELDDASGWMRCRNIRNMTTGHPVDAQYGRLRVTVSRITINKNGFDVLIADRAAPEKLKVDAIGLTAPYDAYKNEALGILSRIEQRQSELLQMIST